MLIATPRFEINCRIMQVYDTKEVIKMFDATKKDTALAALGELCLKCGDKHSDECLLAKAVAAAKAIPTA
jgi:hypothetical protein